MNTPKFLDEYEIMARYVPTVLAAIPLIMLTSMVKTSVWCTLFRNLSWFLVVENLSISLIVILFMMHIQRAVAKYCVERPLFGGELHFPTTTMLLLADNSLSLAMKEKARNKIKRELTIRLLDAQAELADPEEARRSIRDAVGLVRKSVGKGTMTQRYNIQYGFLRNLVVGGYWSVPSAALCAYLLFKNGDAQGAVISSSIGLIFVVLLLLHRPLLRRAAESYAHVLITEFVSQKGKTP